MIQKIKSILLAFVVFCICLSGAAVFIYWSNGSSNTGSAEVKPVHHAGIQDLLVSKINVDAYYFVAADAREREQSPVDFKKQLTTALESTKKFYEYQLGPGFTLNFRTYDEAVIGNQGAKFYNGASTSDGNPNALIAIAKELEDRKAELLPPLDNGFNVIAILYEDVGASAMLLSNTLPTADPGKHVVEISGSERPAFLVSTYFFTGPAYQDYGTTIFAHEFGHILGLQDEYADNENASFTEDIMGSGRFLPINYTFLSRKQLQSLGVLDK